VIFNRGAKMRNHRSSAIRAIVSFALVFSFLASSCSQKYAADYKQLKYPTLGQIEIPQVRRVTLANGMQVFLLEDHELPLVSLSAMVRTGSVYEPADKIGLAAITGTVMRTGGTTSKTGDQIDEQLEQIAASVETGIGLNSGSAALSVLKDDIDTGLSVLADVLMNPVFREDKIELAKVQHRSNIARRNDNMRQIAFREFYKLIYGPQSVYARQTEYATIGNITRDDLVAFHKKFFHPNNTTLAVWGDFDAEQMTKKIEEAFKAWQKADVDVPAVPKVEYEFRQTVSVVRKDDVSQSNIYLGHIGGLMSDPDYFVLEVMSRILSDNVFKNVRSREGLAYSAGGYYWPEYDHRGIFCVGCQTKLQSTVHAIRVMLKEVRKITEAEVTDEELALAKESYLNSFVFNFDSRAEIVRRLMIYQYFGYPEDFLQKTKENVEKVTKADVLRVARKHLQPDKMQILAVGRPQDFDEPLSVFGQVREIDITIPTPQK